MVVRRQSHRYRAILRRPWWKFWGPSWEWRLTGGATYHVFVEDKLGREVLDRYVHYSRDPGVAQVLGRLCAESGRVVVFSGECEPDFEAPRATDPERAALVEQRIKDGRELRKALESVADMTAQLRSKRALSE